jgi:FKBP-type peptidyl-prolyl cis-trans isomerase
MRNKQIFIYIIFGCILLISCVKNTEPIDTVKLRENDEAIQAHLKSLNIVASKNADGAYFVITNQNPSGKKPELGDLMTFQYLTTRLDGFKLDSSKVAIPNYSPYGTINSLWSYLAANIKEGEVLTAYLPYNLAYGTQESTNLPAYSPIKMQFKLDKLSTEDEQINMYISDNKLNATKTETGLRYVISNPIATADALKKGQKVTVKYTGKHLYYQAVYDANGKPTTQFDTGSFSMTLGNGEVVAGFDEGISKFKVGEKGIIIFPSSLGYKDAGQTKIPAKSPLYFDIEIVSAQ